MPSRKAPASFLIFFLFAVLFSFQALPAIFNDSLTNDEPSDIANGYSYWTKGDAVTPHNHPPLGAALQALPLLGMDLKTESALGDAIDRGHRFLFQWNRDKFGAIVLQARFVSWMLGLLVGFVLWRLTRERPVLACFTLFLWALDPAFLALSGLAKTDIAPTLLFFLAVLAFDRAQRNPSAGSFLLAGVAAGAAVNSKFYCLTLLPIFLAMEFLFLREKENLLFRTELKREMRARWIYGLGAFFTFTFFVFLPATLGEFGHHQPFHYFFAKLGEDLEFAQHPFAVFFLGQTSLESHWYYLPVALVLKEPLPFLLLVGAAIGLIVSGRSKVPVWTWIAPLVFFLALLPSLNLGVRYLLPAFPFLFLLAGEGLVWLWSNPFGKRSPFLPRGLALLLCVWQALGVLTAPGSLIAYFNELVPRDQKLHYLGDSNLDWGQDHHRLAETARKRGWRTVKLAYLGGIDPRVYGLDWRPWDNEDLKAPQPGQVYVVNAGFLQLGPVTYPSARPIAQSWIVEREPTGKAGDCWYYFEIPGASNQKAKAEPIVSVPFLEYRGYTPFYTTP